MATALSTSNTLNLPAEKRELLSYRKFQAIGTAFGAVVIAKSHFMNQYYFCGLTG
jgi:hypothetical protein